MVIDMDGNIQGGGNDTVGGFDIRGRVNGDCSVQFIKQYHGQHSVDYNGRLSDNLIRGRWSLTGMEGDFEIQIHTDKLSGYRLINNAQNDETLCLDLE